MTKKIYFNVNTDMDVKSLIEKIQTEIENENGTFEGNEKSGSVVLPSPVGSVHADYKVVDGELELSVTKKPMVLSMGRLKSEIQKIIQEYIS